MKILVNVTHLTAGKRYVFPKFLEMLEACVRPVDGVDVEMVTDQPDHADEMLDAGWDVVVQPPMSTSWQDDTTALGREIGRKSALAKGYDRLVWQGIDCLYDSADDVARLFSHDVPVVGALVAGRNVSHYPVCRRFNDDGTQREIDAELRAAHHLDLVGHIGVSVLVKAGFPGADALVMTHEIAQRYPLGGTRYTPWYATGNFHGMCVEEFWCWTLHRDGVPVYCDPSVRPWHVHETGHAGRWPGEDSHMEELSWS